MMPVAESTWERRTDDCIAALVAALAERAVDADEIGEAVVDSVVGCLDASVLALFRTNATETALDLVASRGLPCDLAQRLQTVALTDGGVLGHAARRRDVEQLDLDDTTRAEEIAHEVILEACTDVRRAVAVPFVFRGRLLGAMELAVARTEPLSLTAHDHLLTLGRLIAYELATSAAATPTRTERVRHAQRAVMSAMSVLPEDQLRAAVRRGFYVWPQFLESSVPEFISSVIQRVADEARGLVGAGIAAIGVGDLPHRQFSPWAFSGVPESAFQATGRVPRPVGTLGIVACKGEVVRVADVTRHPSFRGLPPGHPPVKSLLGVPIRYRGRALGNLYLANKLGDEEFTQEDEHAVQMLAEQAGIALQQAFLQASIEAQRAQTQSLLDSAPHGILFVDGQTRHVMSNPRAMELLGEAITPDAGMEQYIQRLRSPDGRSVSVEATPAYRALHGEEHPTEQFVIVRPDGTEIPIIESAAPVRGFGQKLLGAVVNFVDVSAVRDLERARNVERVREELNATIAHDLRNPIQTVLAQIYLLRKEAEGKEEVQVPVRALERIERSAKTLGRMASVLLDVSRIELKRIELRREPADVPRVVAELVDRMRPALAADGHVIELSVEPCPHVGLDPLAFEEIVTNLVDNAAKYSPAGEAIGVAVRPSGGSVRLSVSDRGPGIPSDKLARIFDRFYSGNGIRERKTGLGLGLFIVKGFVEAHGGRVDVASELGHGTTFDVWLPVIERG